MDDILNTMQSLVANTTELMNRYKNAVNDFETVAENRKNEIEDTAELKKSEIESLGDEKGRELENLFASRLATIAIENGMDEAMYKKLANDFKMSLDGSGFLITGDVNITGDVIGPGMFINLDNRKYLAFAANSGQYEHPVLVSNGKRIVFSTNYRSDWTKDGKYPIFGWCSFDISDPIEVKEIISSKYTCDVDLKEGDFILLSDNEFEFMPDPDFKSGVNGFDYYSYYVDLEYDSDNDRIKITKTTDGTAYIRTEDRTFRYGKYKIEITVDEISEDTKLLVYNSVGVYMFSIEEPGTYTIDYTNVYPYAGLSYLQFYISGGNGSYVYISRLSIKPREELPLIFMRDNYKTAEDALAIKGKDIRDYYTAFSCNMACSSQSIGFVEVWWEDIATRDVVYPYGSVQYKGLRNIFGTRAGLVETTWFDDFDTYSLANKNKEPGSFIGVGWRWSTLSDDDKKILLRNPNHNIIKTDTGSFKQLRWRLRIGRGEGGNWDNIDTQKTGDAYGSTFGQARLHRLVSYRGEKRLSDLDPFELTKWGIGAKTFSYGSSYWGGVRVHSDRGLFKYPTSDGLEILPIFILQRFNTGVYHPTWNPAGTALFYKDGEAKQWWEVPDDINSMRDCFIEANIAALDADGNIVSAADDNAVIRTGYLDSGMSGRHDNGFCDGVHQYQVQDLRTYAKTPDYRTLLDYTERMLLTGRFRGKTSVSFLKRCYANVSTVSTSNTVGKVGGYLLGTYFDFFNDLVYVNRDFTSTLDTETLYTYYSGYVLDDLGKLRKLGYINKNTFKTLPIGWYSDGNGIFTAGNTYTILLHNQVPYHVFGRYVERQVIGDVLPIKDRVGHKTSDGTVDLYRGVVVYCDSNYNNNGTIGNYYRFKGSDITNVELDGTDGEANTNDGHIDLSDESYWVNLGSDGDVGGLKPEWLEKGFEAKLNVINQHSERQLPRERNVYKYEGDVDGDGVTESYYYIQIRPEFPLFSESGGVGTIKRVLLYRDGEFKELNISSKVEDGYNTDLTIVRWNDYIEIPIELDDGTKLFDVDKDVLIIEGYMRANFFNDYPRVDTSFNEVNRVEKVSLLKGQNYHTNFFSHFAAGVSNSNTAVSYDADWATVKHSNFGTWVRYGKNNDNYYVYHNDLNYELKTHPMVKYGLVISEYNLERYYLYQTSTASASAYFRDKLFLNVYFNTVHYNSDTDTFSDADKLDLDNSLQLRTTDNGLLKLIGRRHVSLPFFPRRNYPNMYSMMGWPARYND